ncbi:hypothetical protein LCGC14_1167450 [marine sediment metagenome]|uniref:Uncharacterized protein n=1 Tax=marine sediment metagenome TaxID=412755 RepID=A0A0F9LQY1_9ZZZZ
MKTKMTPEEEVDYLREQIHLALSALEEKSTDLSYSSPPHVNKAYLILEDAFMETAKLSESVMDADKKAKYKIQDEIAEAWREEDRKDRRREIREEIAKANKSGEIEMSEHLTSEIDLDD